MKEMRGRKLLARRKETGAHHGRTDSVQTRGELEKKILKIYLLRNSDLNVIFSALNQKL